MSFTIYTYDRSLKSQETKRKGGWFYTKCKFTAGWHLAISRTEAVSTPPQGVLRFYKFKRGCCWRKRVSKQERNTGKEYSGLYLIQSLSRCGPQILLQLLHFHGHLAHQTPAPRATPTTRFRSIIKPLALIDHLSSSWLHLLFFSVGPLSPESSCFPCSPRPCASAHLLSGPVLCLPSLNSLPDHARGHSTVTLSANLGQSALMAEAHNRGGTVGLTYGITLLLPSS